MVVKENAEFEHKILNHPMLDQPATYRIRVRGELDDSWANRLQV